VLAAAAGCGMQRAQATLPMGCTCNSQVSMVAGTVMVSVLSGAVTRKADVEKLHGVTNNAGQAVSVVSTLQILGHQLDDD